MKVEIVEENAAALADYARIPIAFDVNSVVEARQSGTSGDFTLDERPLSTPYVKDYDALPNNGPLAWTKRFDITNWGFLAAWSNGSRVGGATVVHHFAGIEMLEARDDLAVLWDIRVMPDLRGKGIGSALLAGVERWANERNAPWLKAETQNVNVPACRFYARHGFVLKAANEFAYPDLPGEIQLLWYKEIGA
jgi:GNAT superfamily N-acetyltransferase